MKEKSKKGTNKKQTILLLAIISVLCLAGVGAFLLMNKEEKPADKVVYSGKWDVSWYDDNEKEFVITTKEQLLGLAELSQELNFQGKTIKLGADIVINEGNAEDWKEESPDLDWTPIGSHDNPFNGTFDGQGHTISGLYMDTSDELVGFFSATDEKSQIMNFKLINSYYNYLGDQGIGGVAGRGAGFYSKIYSNVMIDCDGWYVGGIIAFKKNGADCTIQECWYDGQINVTGRMAGGIVGQVFKGGCTISHCHNTGTIYSSYPGPMAATIGGIVGTTNQRLVISDCFNAGKLSNVAGRPEVGAIIGSIGANGDVTSGLIWSTKEGAPTSVGGTNQNATVKGTYFQLPEELLTGFHAYQRTDLNFDKYWAVVEDGTPMLQAFAETIPSAEGLERCMEADTSWYDVTKLENVISTPQQLKGFAYLAASGEKFYGKIIKLGADITYNTGKASKYGKDIPINMWVPVNGFMGTFDGQGHTISGLYVGGAITHVGLFALTEKQATVKNLKITNSYFMSTDTSNSYGVGSVAGGGGGTIERVYSDAIVVSSGRYGGGIVGLFNKDGSISECWFDGEVAITGRRSGGIIGACNNFYIDGNPVPSTVKITHCLNTGYIHRTDTKATDSATSGGIVGVINNSSTTVEDCFSAGIVTSPKYQDKGFDELGAIVSAIASGAKGTIKNCFGTIESYKKVITTIKDDSTSNVDLSAVIEKSMLIGYDSVSFTTLNFNKYWAVDLEGTPVLKCFAKKAPSVAGRIVPNTSWYNEKKTEFVLTTVEQLYGLSVLANSGKTFEGKTVKLGNALTVNTGDAATWKDSAPQNHWYPIKDFAGTFDGQGYAISGLYGKAYEDSTLGMGLFAKTKQTAVIQNVALLDSYFETSAGYGLSAISSRGVGTFANLRTNAILVNHSDAGLTGGILGIVLDGGKDKDGNKVDGIVNISDCWFDGHITDAGYRSGGILGYSNNMKVNVEHCLYSGSIKRAGEKVDNTKEASFGGIIGSAKGTLLVNDCLSVGTIESDIMIINPKKPTAEPTKDRCGTILGRTEGSKPITLTNLYGDSTKWSSAIGRKNAVYKDGTKPDTSGCIQLNNANLIGIKAYYNTELSFGVHWDAITGQTPMLKTFVADKSLVINIDNIIKPNTKWFDKTANTGTITTKEDLFGFSVLASNGDLNANSVIKLGNNIQVNSLDGITSVEEWSNPDKAPVSVWTPIKDFAGTFDGQGYTISGLYMTTGTTNAGFFGNIEDATIQNVRIENSYFESLIGPAEDAHMGSIVGRGYGILRNVSSNAVLYTNGERVGGLVGYAGEQITTDSKTTTYTLNMVSCVYEGKIIIEQKIDAVGAKDGKAQSSSLQSGGLVGYARSVVMDTCLSAGTIQVEHTSVGTSKKYAVASINVGGLIGNIGTSAIVRNSLNAATIHLVWHTNPAFDETASKFNNYGTIVGNKTTLTASNVFSVGTINITLPGQTETTVSYAEFLTDDGEKDNAGVDSTYAGKATELYGDLVKTKTNLPFTLDARLALNDSDTDTNETAIWEVREGNLPKPGKSVAPAVGSTEWYKAGKKNDGAYHIATVEDLYGFATLVNSKKENFEGDTIILDADLVVNLPQTITDIKAGKVVSANKWTPIGTRSTMTSSDGYSFRGTFDGNNHSISGLYVSTTKLYTGLFGFTQDCTIQNLRLLDSYFTTTKECFGSVSGGGDGTFKNIYSEVELNSSNYLVGGIIGRVSDSTTKSTTETLVENCWYNGTITQTMNGQFMAGGIVGYTMTGFVKDDGKYQNIIRNCLYTGNITCNYTGTNASQSIRVGGLCGGNQARSDSELLIDKSVSAGSITVTGPSTTNVGSIIGNPRANGDASASSNVTMCTDVYASNSYNLEVTGDVAYTWSTAQNIDFSNATALTTALNTLNGSNGTIWALNLNAQEDKYKLILSELWSKLNSGK